MSDQDDFPAIMALFDQKIASWRSLVPGLYQHFAASVEAGFTEEQAMTLLMATWLRP